MAIARSKPSTTAVIVIDVQERLVPSMPDARVQQLLRASRIMLTAAKELGAPILVTEQYPKGLGASVAPLLKQMQSVGAPAPIEKVAFSACNEPTFVDKLKEHQVDSAVVLGMETHICVFQTVRDLCARGIQVDVLSDGVSSRRDDHREVGLALCQQAGATVSTAETVLFDWLVQAGTPTFKTLSKLVR
jgi:nicotinamidase-related amidase